MPKVFMELLGAGSLTAISLIIGTPEISLFVMVTLAVLGGLVWAVRLEGRVNAVVNAQQEMKTDLSRRLDRIADHLGVSD